MVLKPGRGKAIRCDDVRWTCWKITTEDTEYTEKGTQDEERVRSENCTLVVRLRDHHGRHGTRGRRVKSGGRSANDSFVFNFRMMTKVHQKTDSMP